MRIYAVADIHGRQRMIESIMENIRRYQPDALVVAGDITSMITPKPTIFALNNMPIPVLMVRGNTDLSRVDRIIQHCSNISSLHLREIIINGISFIGISGTIPVPFRSRICIKENQAISSVEKLLSINSVLVAHPPPFGAQDEVLGKYHTGCRALRNLILRKMPRVMICGHIHERPGTTFINKTLVVNCSMSANGEGAMIDMEKDGNLEVTMLKPKND